MKNLIVYVIAAVGLVTLVSFRMNQNQVPYLSTKLSPYSGGLNINSFASIIAFEKYTKIETGLEDFQMYMGTGNQGNVPLYWFKMESSKGNMFLQIDMSKGMDESSNTCRDTIRNDRFNNNSEMIVLEVIHHLSTDEIQYIWLDGNNNRSEKAIFIPLDLPLKEGKIFPELTVEQLNGEKLSINELTGKTVVINWWATNCGPCIAEMPGFNKLVEQYKENPNIVFIAIAQDKKERVTTFLEKNEFNYIQTLANNEAIKLFGGAMPVSIIINSAGKICYYSRGGHPNMYVEIERILSLFLLLE